MTMALKRRKTGNRTWRIVDKHEKGFKIISGRHHWRITLNENIMEVHAAGEYINVLHVQPYVVNALRLIMFPLGALHDLSTRYIPKNLKGKKK
jgi:hypothetical protein